MVTCELIMATSPPFELFYLLSTHVQKMTPVAPMVQKNLAGKEVISLQ